MKTVNKFNSNGDFVVWEDPIGGGMVRTSTIPQRTVQCLLFWVLDDGKDYGIFPMQNIEREVWGGILAQFRDVEKDGEKVFLVKDMLK